MDIHNVILTINPRLLGIGSILLNAKIMHINVLMFIVYDIFYIVNYQVFNSFGTSTSLRLPWNMSLPYSSIISPNEGFMTLVDIDIG